MIELEVRIRYILDDLFNDRLSVEETVKAIMQVIEEDRDCEYPLCPKKQQRTTNIELDHRFKTGERGYGLPPDAHQRRM